MPICFALEAVVRERYYYKVEESVAVGTAFEVEMTLSFDSFLPRRCSHLLLKNFDSQWGKDQVSANQQATCGLQDARERGRVTRWRNDQEALLVDFEITRDGCHLGSLE